MHRSAKTLQRIATLCAAMTLGFNTCASAQLAHSWNVQAREQAERSTSAGMSMLLKRKTAQAISTFEQASQTDPTDPNPYSALGLALAMEGKLDEALHALQRSYSLRQATETLLSTGIVYYLQRDYDAAINAWTKVIEANPKNCQVWGDLGFAHLRKGQFSEADELFQKLVKCRPNSQFGYHGIALAKYFKGDFSGSRRAAERAQSIQPYAPVVLILAKLDALQGDRLSALKRAQQYNTTANRRSIPERSMTEIGIPLQRDFRWDPFKADSLDNGYLLAARLQDAANADKQLALAEQGKASQAIGSAKDILVKDPRDLFVLRELALAQMAQAEFANASESFKAVLERAPHCYVDLLHLARALAMDGKAAEGAAYVREFQNKLPGVKISPLLANIGQEPNPPPQPVLESTKQPKEEVIAKPKVKRETKVKNKPKAFSTPTTEVENAAKDAPKVSAPATTNDTRAIPASEF